MRLVPSASATSSRPRISASGGDIDLDSWSISLPARAWRAVSQTIGLASSGEELGHGKCIAGRGRHPAFGGGIVDGAEAGHEASANDSLWQGVRAGAKKKW
jgi:hypothetical protein